MVRLVRTPAPLLLSAMLLAGCSGDGSLLGGGITTASVPPPSVDPVCVSLTAEIDGLRKDGVAEKIEKAAAKKYKMTNKDLAKADQLNKANADFQNRCGLKPAGSTTAEAPAAPAAATPAAAPTTVAATARPAAQPPQPIMRPADGN